MDFANKMWVCFYELEYESFKYFKMEISSLLILVKEVNCHVTTKIFSWEKFFNVFVIYYKQPSPNGTLIQVYEGFRTSDNCCLLNEIKFKAMSAVRISDDF